jgi:hypothetical protein
MKYLILTAALAATPAMATPPVVVVTPNQFATQQVITPSGTYLVIPTATGGGPVTVIQVSKGGKK